MKAVLLFLALALPAALGLLFPTKEVCCEDIGCFNNDGIFSHLPLPHCPEDIKTTFKLYTRENRQDGEELVLGQIPHDYDGSRRTVISSHGWFGDGELWWLVQAKDRILDMMDVNFIIIDWKKGSEAVYYPTSASTTRTVGALAALMLDQLVEFGGDSYHNMWCIGFSLGAHVCGHAGMRTKEKLGRISAMDAAGPSFMKRDLKVGLNPDCAEFVDVIHSDGWGYTPAYYGMLEQRGHIDFYPNGGYRQPGCLTKRSDPEQEEEPFNPEDIMQYGEGVGCSHYRSVYFFMGTLDNHDCHLARHVCTDPHKTPKSCTPCEEGVCAKLGYEADKGPRTSGIFYLETEKSEPYCKF